MLAVTVVDPMARLLRGSVTPMMKLAKTRVLEQGKSTNGYSNQRMSVPCLANGTLNGFPRS